MSPSLTLHNPSMCMINIAKYKNFMIMDILVHIINLPSMLLDTICFIIIKMKQNTVYQMFEILNTQNSVNGFNIF